MKKGLGRGFDSLIPATLIDESFDPTAAQDGKVSTLQELAIDSIQPDSEQPRRFFDEKALQELSLSIKEHGVLQPIVVTAQKKGERKGYVIVAGERRWRASKLAGVTKIPAIVRTLSAQHRLEVSLIENLQRRDLNPLETATAYLKLRDQFNMTLEQIGQRVGGKSVSAVSNTLRLLKLPKSVQEAIFDGRLSEGQARPMIGVPEELAAELLEKIIGEGWSTRRIEQWITDWKRSDKKVTKDSAEPIEQPYAKEIERLNERFASPVTIRTKANGAGNIVISFKNAQEFERIRGLLS